MATDIDLHLGKRMFVDAEAESEKVNPVMNHMQMLQNAFGSGDLGSAEA